MTIGLSKRTHPVDWASSSHALCTDHKYTHQPTIMGNDVWIGHNVVIMEGVEIGHGAVIGINSVVTKSVEPYQIVAGNPAQPIRYRFNESIKTRLLKSEWWTKDLDDLKKLDYENADNFALAASSVAKKANYNKIKLNQVEVCVFNGGSENQQRT